MKEKEHKSSIIDIINEQEAFPDNSSDSDRAISPRSFKTRNWGYYVSESVLETLLQGRDKHEKEQILKQLKEDSDQLEMELNSGKITSSTMEEINDCYGSIVDTVGSLLDDIYNATENVRWTM